MKNIFLKTILGLYLVIVSGEAFAFYPQMQVFVSPQVATVRVFNQSYYPIVCSGVVYGRTYYGYVGQVWENNVWVYPGQFNDLYVYATNPYYDPMVQAWANLDCRYTW